MKERHSGVKFNLRQLFKDKDDGMFLFDITVHVLYKCSYISCFLHANLHTFVSTTFYLSKQKLNSQNIQVIYPAV